LCAFTFDYRGTINAAGTSVRRSALFARRSSRGHLAVARWDVSGLPCPAATGDPGVPP